MTSPTIYVTQEIVRKVWDRIANLPSACQRGVGVRLRAAGAGVKSARATPCPWAARGQLPACHSFPVLRYYPSSRRFALAHPKRSCTKEPVMSRRWGIALLVFLIPTLGRAQDAPEDLLPAGTQLYLRWDGVEAHRAAYEKTALGKMMQGDTGKFITS